MPDIYNKDDSYEEKSLITSFRSDKADEIIKSITGLGKTEELYQRMIDEVEDYAIVLLDENGIIQNWNKGAEKIKGYKPEDIIGKSFSNFYFEEDRLNNLPQKLLAEAKNKGRAVHEGWRRRNDGTRFWGSIVITAIHDNDNNVVGYSKVTRDLTERKNAEDRLKNYANQLEFQNKELEQFAYAVSHDMKEPLRKINYYTQYLLVNNAENLDPKSKIYLERSANAAKRMATLIDDLLAYSHAHSPVTSFEITDLHKVVQEIIDSHIDIIEKSEAEIEITSQLPTLQAIPFQLKQLMDNLINNAIQYKHPEKKAVVEISCIKLIGNETGMIEAVPNAEYYKISVTDNGIGFNQEYAERIFEIFQRLTPLKGYKGTGIGLAICKRIVQNHLGFIQAISRENEGATFNVFLPAQ